MKTSKWVLVHLIHWALLWGAFAADIQGAMYTIKFWVWVCAVLGVYQLTDESVKSVARRPPQAAWQTSLGWIQAWVTLSVLVWFGHFASALAWGWVMAVVNWQGARAAEMRKAEANATQASKE